MCKNSQHENLIEYSWNRATLLFEAPRTQLYKKLVCRDWLAEAAMMLLITVYWRGRHKNWAVLRLCGDLCQQVCDTRREALSPRTQECGASPNRHCRVVGLERRAAGSSNRICTSDVQIVIRRWLRCCKRTWKEMGKKKETARFEDVTGFPFELCSYKE